MELKFVDKSKYFNNEPKMTEKTNISRKSIVQVYFEERDRSWAYYNDQFDLHCGDIVYVEGKLEGVQGRIVEINYNFKIKLSDYKKVIAVADTNIKGQLFIMEKHFVTFDRNVLPQSKVISWFKPPLKEDDEIITGYDDKQFDIDHLNKADMAESIKERGQYYFEDDRVKYLCLDKTKGYAIVEGNKNYEVEFEYIDGLIKNLTCDCYCASHCKHEYAVMLQLKDMLEQIDENYADEYKQTGYFAIIDKSFLLNLIVYNKKTGSIIL